MDIRKYLPERNCYCKVENAMLDPETTTLADTCETQLAKQDNGNKDCRIQFASTSWCEKSFGRLYLHSRYSSNSFT